MKLYEIRTSWSGYNNVASKSGVIKAIEDLLGHGKNHHGFEIESRCKVYADEFTDNNSLVSLYMNKVDKKGVARMLEVLETRDVYKIVVKFESVENEVEISIINLRIIK